MNKHRSSDKSAISGKKQRKSITLEGKLDVTKRYEHNKCKVDIANAMGIPKLTLRTIRKQAEKLKKSCKSAMRITASKIKQIRTLIVEKFERMLLQ
jgi:glucosamine 6-phosphate synthetase-like amidotransferase/phosphosugar isomerase protein